MMSWSLYFVDLCFTGYAENILSILLIFSTFFMWRNTSICTCKPILTLTNKYAYLFSYMKYASHLSYYTSSLCLCFCLLLGVIFQLIAFLKTILWFLWFSMCFSIFQLWWTHKKDTQQKCILNILKHSKIKYI